MLLETPISKVAKIGPSFARKLRKLKINTIHDLLFHIPSRYENYGLPKSISQLKPGLIASVKGRVLECRNIYTKYGKKLTVAYISDQSGTIKAVWFNQHYLTKIIKTNSSVYLAGKIDFFSGQLSLINPEYEVDEGNQSIHATGIVPIYPETSGISSKWLRGKIRYLLPEALKEIKEPLAQESLKNYGLLTLQEAIQKIHFPAQLSDIEQARKRIAFHELFQIQIMSALKRYEWQNQNKAPQIMIDQEKLLSFISQLPFELTNSQKRVLKEIIADFRSNVPMNRLLQGDVGSGKTVIAAIAIYISYLNGFQSALMAPTQILALQHYKTVSEILSGMGVKIALITNSRQFLTDFDCYIGTHALLSNRINFKNLGLVVIDEQHRFGVEQRAILRSKAVSPHTLTMTATPIPRSLALTFYSYLDISLLDEVPKGRKPVKTFIVPEEKRNNAYQFLRENIAKGYQAFIICPLIDPSETKESVKAANQEYEKLKTIFPEIGLGLLHGRLKAKEKEAVLNDFLNKKISILVATPVVEVGIDVPNANIMIIEGAERFGLASLHQMRGRVGRGAIDSYCFLFTDSKTPTVLKRLSALVKTNDGLKLATLDLENRGAGELYGTAQSGFPNFKAADLSDLDLIKKTKYEAERLLERLTREAKSKLMQTSSLISPD